MNGTRPKARLPASASTCPLHPLRRRGSCRASGSPRWPSLGWTLVLGENNPSRWFQKQKLLLLHGSSRSLESRWPSLIQRQRIEMMLLTIPFCRAKPSPVIFWCVRNVVIVAWTIGMIWKYGGELCTILWSFCYFVGRFVWLIFWNPNLTLKFANLCDIFYEAYVPKYLPYNYWDNK